MAPGVGFEPTFDFTVGVKISHMIVGKFIWWEVGFSIWWYIWAK